MRPLSRAMVLLAVLVIFIGCGGGGSGGTVQSQSPSASTPMSAPWFDPANNIISNAGFEAVSDCYTSLLCPDDWDRNLYFQLPPNWDPDATDNAVVRATEEHLGVDVYDGIYMATISSSGLSKASISQNLDFSGLAPYPSPPIFNISFWYNMYAFYRYEGIPPYAAKLQAWLIEYEDDPSTGKYFQLFEVAYKDRDKEYAPWNATAGPSGSILGWKHFSTSRKLDSEKNYVLFFQVLTDYDDYDVRVTGFIDDVMVVPIPSPPGLSDGA